MVCDNLCNVFSMEMGVKRKDLQVQILSFLLKASGRDGGNNEIGGEKLKGRTREAVGKVTLSTKKLKKPSQTC